MFSYIFMRNVWHHFLKTDCAYASKLSNDRECSWLLEHDHLNC